MKIKKAFSLFFLAASLSISAIVLILAAFVLPCDGFHTVCTLGIVLTIIVLVLIFILISLTYFLKPISYLISSTKEISNGNFDFSLPTDRKDEIGELARNFFDMKEKVRNTQKELLKLNVDSVGEKVEYEVIHNSITDGIVVLDDKLRMRIMNSAAEKLLKISKKETLEKVFSDVVKTKDPETGKTIEKLINDFNDSGRDKFFPEDILKISSDSDLHEIKLNMSKIFVNDNFFGLGLVFHDMTKIRQMEKELVKRQKLESVSVLAGGVAHNFNNALMGILGNLQLAQKYAEKEGAEKQNHYLSKAIVATKGAGEITEQLLVFSRGGEPVKKTIRFGDMLRKTVRFTMTSSQTDA
ncbi:MAG: HAMP domain-containing protein, partial [bacterium]